MVSVRVWSVLRYIPLDALSRSLSLPLPSIHGRVAGRSSKSTMVVPVFGYMDEASHTPSNTPAERDSRKHEND